VLRGLPWAWGRATPAAAAILAAAFGLGGCRTQQGPLGPPLHKDIRPSEIVRRQAERDARVRTLRAYAKVHLEGPRRKSSFSEAIVVARPDRLRLDTVGPFGRVFSILAADASALRFVSPGDRRIYQGPPTAENLGRFLPFALNLEDVVSVLLGGLPVPASTPTVHYDEKEAALVVRLENRSGSVSLATLDARTLDLRRLQLIDPPPRLAAVLDYEGWRPEGGVSFPSRISIRVPSRDLSVTVRFEKLEPNAPLDEGLFAPRVPPGFATIPIETLPPAPEENLPPGLPEGDVS
jgi:outer membrane lipoprotein-sorting protein